MNHGDGEGNGPPFAAGKDFRPRGGAGQSAFRRTLFPLPSIATVSARGAHGSRSRRRCRDVALERELVADALASLNAMAGTGTGFSEPSHLPVFQDEVIARAEDLAKRLCRARAEAPAPRTALKQLLRNASCYEPAGSSTLAPFHSDRVALPQDVSSSRDIRELLSEPDRLLVEVEDQPLLLSASEAHERLLQAPRQAYTDPCLIKHRRTYAKFVRTLSDRNMLRFTLNPVEFIGVFFVFKKDMFHLRMITDARRSNCHFGDPPPVRLLTGEGLASLQIDVDPAGDFDSINASGFWNSVSLCLAVADVDNCFHRMVMPPWMSKYFSWQPAKAEELHLVGKVVDGVTLKLGDHVWPCCRMLPMGFTWSLYFAQSIGEKFCRETPSLRTSTIMNDYSGPAVIRVDDKSWDSLFHFIYVDNAGCLGLNGVKVKGSMESLCQRLNDAGLTTHERQDSTGDVTVLGVDLCCTKLRTRPTGKRVWRIRSAITEFLRRERASGRETEVLIGH